MRKRHKREERRWKLRELTKENLKDDGEELHRNREKGELKKG